MLCLIILVSLMSPFLSSHCLPDVSISSSSLSLSSLLFVNILILTAYVMIVIIFCMIAIRIFHFHHHFHFHGKMFHEWYYCPGYPSSFSFTFFPHISFLSLCFSYRQSSIFFLTLPLYFSCALHFFIFFFLFFV